VVASQYKKKRKEYERTAKAWTTKYAGGKGSPGDEKEEKEVKKARDASAIKWPSMYG